MQKVKFIKHSGGRTISEMFALASLQGGLEGDWLSPAPGLDEVYFRSVSVAEETNRVGSTGRRRFSNRLAVKREANRVLVIVESNSKLGDRILCSFENIIPFNNTTNMAKGKLAKSINELLENVPDNRRQNQPIAGNNAAFTKFPEVINIQLNMISASPTNPRKTFDIDAIADLAESMKAVGLLQPITLRAKQGTDKFEIVAGERRYRAAKLLKWETIPAIVIVATDEQVLEIQIIENLQREDVSPLDEAAAFRTLLAKESLDWLTARIHKSKKYVSDRLQLNELLEEGKEYLGQGRLPLSHAVMISKLPGNEQKLALDYVMNYDHTSDEHDRRACTKTLTDLRDHIGAMLMTDFKKACFDLDVENLVDGVCACSACPKRTLNQNLLFSEITEDDKCTDAACFQAKEKAHIKLAMQAAKSKNEKGNVFTGEVSYNNNQVIVQGVSVPCSKTKTKGRDMAAVVITKTKWGGEKKKLGTTVYIDKALLDKEKEEEKENKAQRQSSGYSHSSWQDEQKKQYAELEVPRLKTFPDLLEAGTPTTRIKIIEQFLIGLLDKSDLRDVMSAATYLGLHKTERKDEQMWEIDEEFESENGDNYWRLKTDLFTKLVKNYSINDMLVLLALLHGVDTDNDDKVRTEEEREDDDDAFHNWPELMALLSETMSPGKTVIEDEIKTTKGRKKAKG